MVLFLATLAFGQKAPETDSKEDWQRMKDCAAQAEKVGPVQAEANKGTYTNHYSPKYGRCFLRIVWWSSDSVRNIRLMDAYEHENLALYQPGHPDTGSKDACLLLTAVAECSVVWDFIAERMRN